MRDNTAPKTIVREGIVLSTTIRLTTSDGRAFDDPTKAFEHEAFYQILKRLVKEAGWPDDDETAGFALKLARIYRDLLPLLQDLKQQTEAVEDRLKTYPRLA